VKKKPTSDKAPERGRALAGALVRWFRASNRDLPWRRTRDPYAIWVSEIMLQQTRVEAVVPYYDRFVARFPTVHALADAPIDDVLHAWSGLGYYRRARQLHAAAAVVVGEHAGTVPGDDEALRALPGIGRYTAGAIRSIAFGHAAPIVDGNVARVLSRLFALKGGPGDTAWEKRLWTLAAQLVPASDPSGFNQGLMELGATVCLPRAPRCEACPLAKFCKAHALGREEAFPPPKPRAKVERVERWALLTRRRSDGALLLRRLAEDERNAGQWELPLIEPRAGLPRGASEIGTIRHAILSRFGLYRKTTGNIAGEGAAFFLLAKEPDGDYQAVLKAVQTMYKPFIMQEDISQFLAAHDLMNEPPGLIIHAETGKDKSKQNYQALKNAFPDTPEFAYKSLCGDFPTSSGFALWFASLLLKEQRVPAWMHRIKFPLKNIFIHRQDGLHHSFYLISSD